MSAHRFDAFISYAHEDAAAARRLADFLARYWIPGKRRRAVFLDTQNLAAGVLPDELKQNLADSRFLVVCCSRDARESPWVDREVTEFAASHGDSSHVLACRVGAVDDDALPRTIESLELFIPDLRGPKRDRIRGAAALLAPLVGLRDAQAVLARRTRTLFALGAGIILLLAFATAGLLAWKRWLRTPAGVHRTILQRVTATAERINDPELIPTVNAVAATDGADAMRGIASLIDDAEFKAAALASGYLSLPKPDCTGAAEQLRNVHPSPLGIEAWRTTLFAHAQARCGGDWLARVRPPGVINGMWVIALGDAGLSDELRSGKAGAPIEFQIEAEVALGIATREPIAVTPADLQRWSSQPDFDAYQVLSLLKRIESGHAQGDPFASRLCDFALKTIREQGTIDPWSDLAQVAALLAGAHRAGDARNVLAMADRARNPSQRADPADATGWSWRAIAWHRLGDGAKATAALDRAEGVARMQIPASRTWSEWQDIAVAAATLGDWDRARRAAESAGNERVRVLHLCALLQEWAAAKPGLAAASSMDHQMAQRLPASRTIFEVSGQPNAWWNAGMFATVPFTRNGPCACGSVRARRVASAGAMFSAHTWAKPRKKRCSGVKPSMVRRGFPSSDFWYAA
jgi:hypothetical protein